MNTKTVLGVSLGAIFAISMIFAQSAMAGATHLSILEFEQGNGAGFLSAQFTVADTIPLDGSAGAFGYGAITGFTDAEEPENVLALTTHLCAADHLLQSKAGKKTCDDTIGVLKLLGAAPNDKHHNGPEMHAHVLDLKVVPEGSPCEDTNAEVEVDISRTLTTENNLIAMYTIQIDDSESGEGDVIRVSAPTNELAGEEAVAYASYTITPFADKKGNITNLCLTDLSLSLVDGE